MKIEQFTAETSATEISGLTISTQTSFVYIQNNSLFDFAIGVDNTVTLTTGYIVRALSETPIPFDGNTVRLFSIAASQITACIFVQG